MWFSASFLPAGHFRGVSEGGRDVGWEAERRGRPAWHLRGTRCYFAAGNLTGKVARARGAEVDETLDLIERGRLTVPEGVSLEDFAARGGPSPSGPHPPRQLTAARRPGSWTSSGA